MTTKVGVRGGAQLAEDVGFPPLEAAKSGWARYPVLTGEEPDGAVDLWSRFARGVEGCSANPDKHGSLS